MIDAPEKIATATKKSRRGRPSVSAKRNSATKAPKNRPGGSRKKLALERTFSDPDVAPFDQVKWERREASITDETGASIFKQDNVEVPENWSQLATKVVCSKYFYGDPDKTDE
ncbi:MAG: ribonucleoside-diphosphate reductase alpha chain, partial [Limisphaerales bacterium]